MIKEEGNVDFNLKDLSNPKMFQGAIEILGCEAESLMSSLEMMYRIRFVEEHIALGRKEGLIGGPVHLGSGQEAVAVGVASLLRKTDRVFGAHRSHSHILSQGASVHKLFAEVLGKNTGLSKGMGGSMHLTDIDNGFFGSTPIVAGTVSLAVGAAMAAKLQGVDDIGVAYFGDGAVEEGTVHESMNFAKITKSPVLFIVENNLLSSHMHMSERQPVLSTARFAKAHDMEFEIVDGNDVVAVEKATERLVKLCRSGNGPAFLEVITYRYFGHVDWRDDIDVGINRSIGELNEWKKRDPIKRLVKSLLHNNICTAEEISNIENKIMEEIDVAWQTAISDEFPPASALLERVYNSTNRGNE